MGKRFLCYTRKKEGNHSKINGVAYDIYGEKRDRRMESAEIKRTKLPLLPRMQKGRGVLVTQTRRI